MRITHNLFHKKAKSHSTTENAIFLLEIFYIISDDVTCSYQHKMKILNAFINSLQMTSKRRQMFPCESV